jgi:hypothetical protein
MSSAGGVDQPQSSWAATLGRDAEVASKCEKGGVVSLTRSNILTFEDPKVHLEGRKGRKQAIGFLESWEALGITHL